MNITLRRATVSDAEILTKMNLQLIEDENSRNTMMFDALLKRMRSWLYGEYTAILVFNNSDIVGYAIYRQDQDQYNPDQPVVYVRQFFIQRDKRRVGIGREAFEMISKELFSPGCKITLEVLETNSAGRVFWGKIGFKPYSTLFYRV